MRSAVRSTRGWPRSVDGAVGILAQNLIHRCAASVPTRRRPGRAQDAAARLIYFGPRMDAPPADPYEGTLLTMSRRSRLNFRAARTRRSRTSARDHGLGAVISMLGRRGLSCANSAAGCRRYRRPRARRPPLNAQPAVCDAGTGVGSYPASPTSPNLCEFGVESEAGLGGLSPNCFFC